jgi:hypothetical protein
VRSWSCHYPNGVVGLVFGDNGEYFAGLAHELHSEIRRVPTLEQAMAVADEKAGHQSAPAFWIDSAKPPHPHPEPPPLTARRRRCAMCPQYSDSLRWTSTKVLPPWGLGIKAFLQGTEWPPGAQWVVMDAYQCWWCGHTEMNERPRE